MKVGAEVLIISIVVGLCCAISAIYIIHEYWPVVLAITAGVLLYKHYNPKPHNREKCKECQRSRHT